MNKRKIAFAFYRLINIFPFNNQIKGNVSIENQGAILCRCRVISHGKNNKIILEKNTFLDRCTIRMFGSNNIIRIGENCLARNVSFHMEDSANTITIGSNTDLCGKAQLATMEGTAITVGEGCLFSSEIMIVTGDSHSILNEDGRRINPSQNIQIGNRVWIGHHVSVKKNVSVADDTMIGEGAIVTRTFDAPNTVLAGVPAKVIKTGVHWDYNRV